MIFFPPANERNLQISKKDILMFFSHAYTICKCYTYNIPTTYLHLLDIIYSPHITLIVAASAINGYASESNQLRVGGVVQGSNSNLNYISRLLSQNMFNRCKTN